MRVLFVVLSAALVVVGLAGAAGAQPSGLVERSREATAAMNERRFDEAVGMYREILKAQPGDPGLLMNLGMALAMAGREHDAIEPLERAIKLRPTLMPAHMFLGSSLLALGQPEKAVAPLERVVKARPKDVESIGLLAQAYLASGNASRAVASFRSMSELAPDAPAAWYGLGHAYNGIVQQGIDALDREPAESPWKALLLADALREDGRLHDAFGQYRAALEQLPQMRSLHETIAAIYEKTGHGDWAATSRKRAAAIAIECAKHKAECDFGAKRFRAALAATTSRTDAESLYWRVRAANELARAAFATLDGLPDARERREMRAEMARSDGRYNDAIKEIQAALGFAPDDPRLLEELGTAYYLARDYERALSVIAPLLGAAPDSAGLLALQGETLLELQRLDEALPPLKRAVELEPADTTARAALGRAYVLKGEFAAAIPLLEASLSLDEDGALHFQLARAYQSTGQPDKAKPLLEKYQELQQATQQRTTGASESKITPP